MPAARLSVLTISQPTLKTLVPNAGSPIKRADHLLTALAEGALQWVARSAEVDGAPTPFGVLRWTSGALWVGELLRRDCLRYLIRRKSPDELRLRTADYTIIEGLTHETVWRPCTSAFRCRRVGSSPAIGPVNLDV